MICKKAVGVTRGIRRPTQTGRTNPVFLIPPSGHAPVMASALSVGDLSVRMRNDGHEPNGAEKQ